MRLGFWLVLLSLILAGSHSALAQTKGVQRIDVKTQTGETIPLYQQSHALLIGISDYTNGWPDLTAIPDELAEVKRALEANGFNVELQLNLDSAGLNNAFKDFIDKYGYEAENRLLFFFSGHGDTLDDEGYLVPADAPNSNLDPIGFKRKALSMIDILAWSRKMDAKHALFLFDSCFSGTVFKTRALPAVPPAITHATQRKVRQYITAGDAGQEVPAKSTFTPMFVDALDYRKGDLNQDGYITGAELGLHLSQELPNYIDNQNPQYGKIRDYGLSQGDFVFQLASIPTVPDKDIAVLPQGPTKVRLAVKSTPLDAQVRIMNIVPVYQPGIELEPGRYDIEVSKPDYVTYRQWHELEAGDQVLNIELVSSVPSLSSPANITLSDSTPRSRSLQDSLKYGGKGPEMVLIKGGCYQMGSPRDEEGRDSDEEQHDICVEDFYIGKYEVTFAEYDAFAEATSREKPGDEGWGRGNRPVINVSWFDAVAYLEWLSEQTGKQYRLPTEAEWEYAARAETPTPFHFGNTINTSQANFGGSLGKTVPVGQYEANAWGLHDVHGNVWEWTCSEYVGKYGGQEKRCISNNDANSVQLVFRGGSRTFEPAGMRSANRDWLRPSSRYFLLGFRAARSP